jgi:hypothetical protein
MIIAQKLRKENIIEYILYMWQVEDIIRAYGCSLAKMKENYISKFEVSDLEQYEEMVDWYGNLITMMNQEGKRKSGHLTINEILVQDINELNVQLLESPNFPFYNAEYYKVLPFIVELRNKGRKDVSEIETCLNALYGVMMLRLQKKEISQQTLNAVTEISTFLGMLSDYYIKNKTEGLKFDDDIN